MDAYDWNQHYLSAHAPWTVPDPVLVAESESLSPGRALELGCGEGADALWLAERGWQVTCVDSAPAAIATVAGLAERRAVEVCAIAADVTSHRHAEFDLVFMCYLHLASDERQAMLANACAMLAPGATLIYIGIARSADETDAGFFPGPDQVSGELVGVAIEVARAEQRTVHCPEGPFECSGVLVRARRAPGPGER